MNLPVSEIDAGWLIAYLFCIFKKKKQTQRRLWLKPSLWSNHHVSYGQNQRGGAS